MNNKIKAAGISIISNTILVLSKLIVGIFTNSISIISEAVHSLVDLLASFIAFIAVKISSNPADEDHQYGHGKFEEVSGFIEGFLIILAAFYIIYESVEKLINKNFDYIDSFLGIIVMSISIVANILVSKYLFKVAKETDSIALHADAEHLRTDVITSAGVLIALICIKITGIKIFDPIVAILVGLLIIKAGLNLCIDSSKNILDSSLSKANLEDIKKILKSYCSIQKIISFNNLKTRKSGPNKFIEFTIVLPKGLRIKEAHIICDEIEIELKNILFNSSVTIHTEPCNNECLKLNKCSHQNLQEKCHYHKECF